MGVVTVGELKPNFTGKRGFRLSSTIRHASEWPISDVSSDLTIQIGSSTFNLHKFPLVSRSGRIRKLITDSKTTTISLPNLPGGSEAFELAAKFCYGISIDINLQNIAKLHCSSHYLEMTEEISDQNLLTKTEHFLNQSIFPNISNSIIVLHHSETLIPISEEINLINRLILQITNNACKEQLTAGLLKLDYSFSGTNIEPDRVGPSIRMASMNLEATLEPETPLNWWGKSLALLNLDFFQRVISSIKSKGLKHDVICKILIYYTNKSIIREKIQDLESKKKQSLIVETIVRLLPTQGRRSLVPMAFLSSLLKMVIAIEIPSWYVKSDLERRIGLQLDQAILEDVLIPTNNNNNNNNNNNMIYEIDSIFRIFSIFLNVDEDEEEERCDLRRFSDESEMVFDFDSPESSKERSILKVSKLMDNYLAEIALDPNLMSSKFIGLAEVLPDHARIISDGLYRAVDIYLKVHPNIKDSERYRLCKTIDSQKLSQEACSHAAQNERLPVQMAVQVLYFEQIRLRNAMTTSIIGPNSHFLFNTNSSHHFPQRSGSGAGSGAISPRDNYASVRRENRELKLEVARMRMRLTDLEKDHISIKQELVKSNPGIKLFKSFTKKLTKLNSLFSFTNLKPTLTSKLGFENRFLFQKKRRHSIS